MNENKLHTGPEIQVDKLRNEDPRPGELAILEGAVSPTKQLIRATFNSTILPKSIDRSKRRVTAIISSDIIDRAGDVIRVEGWEFGNFRKNPVVMFGHDYSTPPIGRAVSLEVVDALEVGKAIREGEDSGFLPRSGKVLQATTEFAETEFAREVFDLYADGFMRAFSVGFIAKAYKVIYDEKNRLVGFEFTRQELLEYSAVPIPANPEALVAAIGGGRFKKASEIFGDRFRRAEQPDRALEALDAITERERLREAGRSVDEVIKHLGG